MDMKNLTLPFAFATEDARTRGGKRYAAIKLRDNSFDNWLTKMQKTQPGSITNEFQQLQRTIKEHGNTMDIWRTNSDFNRYNDMICFDQTRVVLSDGLQPDYIHANWVNGYGRKNAYILTQGPLDNTTCDMWRMVWQEKIAVVVMVTRLQERGKNKCSRYFPLSNESDFRSGMFKITLITYQKIPMCWTSLLKVTNLLNDEVRHVVHVWYVSWPDQGVPENTPTFRTFLNFVKTTNVNMENFYQCKHIRGPPIVFHCSAGIGRSAVLVVLDTITEGMLHGDFHDPYELVQEIRKQRYHAVHTKIQLLFVYDYVMTLAFRYGWAHQR